MSDATTKSAVRLTWFPKALAGASAGEVARATRSAGLTRCNAVIRDTYPTPPGTLARTLGPWLDALRAEGVACDFATTNWTPGDLAGAESDLAALAERGVSDVRLAQINSGGKFGGVGDVPAELEAAKRDFDHAARLLEKHRLRGVYQVHFKTLLPSPSSLWPMVADLPAERMAVMLDPRQPDDRGGGKPRPLDVAVRPRPRRRRRRERSAVGARRRRYPRPTSSCPSAMGWSAGRPR